RPCRFSSVTASPATYSASTGRRGQMTLRRPDSRWVQVASPAADAVERLARELLVPDTVCRLLVTRGYEEPELAMRFLRPRLDHLEAPECLADMSRAVERVANAVRDGETILVHGDYDVDGMSSVALLVRVLRAVGAKNVVPFVPNRLRDGYDL